jgi:hypothetical protein
MQYTRTVPRLRLSLMPCRLAQTPIQVIMPVARPGPCFN